MGRTVRHPRSDTRRSVSTGKHGDWRRPHQSLECRAAATFLHIGSFRLLVTWLFSHAPAVAALCKQLPSRHSVTITIAALMNKYRKPTYCDSYVLSTPNGPVERLHFYKLLMHSRYLGASPNSTSYSHTIQTGLGAAPPQWYQHTTWSFQRPSNARRLSATSAFMSAITISGIPDISGISRP